MTDEIMDAPAPRDDAAGAGAPSEASAPGATERAPAKARAAALRERLLELSLADAARLEPRIARLERGRREPPGRIASLERAVDEAARVVTGRRRLALSTALNAQLPIAAARDALAKAITDHPVVVVCGETGSGKTTQLPKLCLALGRGIRGLVGHTQPRRVAARTVAARVASELGAHGSDAVGVKVRFDSRVGAAARIKMMTDGIALAEIHSDPDLLAYDTLIIDEAHERSLNIDFLLGYLRDLLRRRSDLRVIISSATLDAARFADYFAQADGRPAPVVEVEGRTYPIEIRHAEEDERDDRPLPDRMADAIRALCAEGPGDVLAFLPGEQDILATREKLKNLRNTEVLPLFARLPYPRQQRVFGAPDDPRTRRVVLATNVAETSLTVPRIRYVVDCGLARISRYNPRAALERLPIEQISQAAANQRAGRCGRVGPGVCKRLYSRETFEAADPFTDPEVRRSNLGSVLLRLKILGYDAEAGGAPGTAKTFAFLDPPDRRHVNDGYRLLRELAALDEDGELTRMGRRLARWPLDPSLARILLEAERLDCLHDALVLTAVLSVGDPREKAGPRELGRRERFADPRSDFLTLLSLWHAWHDAPNAGGGGGAGGKGGRAARETFCDRLGLSARRMREWREVETELKRVARDEGLRLDKADDAGQGYYGRLHRALLGGLLRCVGKREEKGVYVGVRDARFRLSRASALFDAKPTWVMAAELVETKSTFAHVAARVRPEWVERAAKPLLKRDYFGATWDAQRGEAMILEQTTLFGLIITGRRKVRFAPVSREDARELMIRSALVERREGLAAHSARTAASAKAAGEPRVKRNQSIATGAAGAVFAHNAKVMRELREYDHRLRQPDVVVTDEALVEFYDERLPRKLCDLVGLRQWISASPGNAERITLYPESLRRAPLPGGFEAALPDELVIDGLHLPVRYRFAAGEADDGVTVRLPLDSLASLDPARLEWLVPGMLPEKVECLLRMLGKAQRRELMPLPGMSHQFTDLAGAQPDWRRAGLATMLAQFCWNTRGVEVSEETLSEAMHSEKMPVYLRMHVEVVETTADGKVSVVADGRDLAALQLRLRGRAAATRARRRAQVPTAKAVAAQTTASHERAGAAPGAPHIVVQDGPWPFGDLPLRINAALGVAGGDLSGRGAFAALVDHGDGVSVTPIESPLAARRATATALGALFRTAARQRLATHERRVAKDAQATLAYALLPIAECGEPAKRGQKLGYGADLVAAAVAEATRFDLTPFEGAAAEKSAAEKSAAEKSAAEISETGETLGDDDPMAVRTGEDFERWCALAWARFDTSLEALLGLAPALLDQYRATRLARGALDERRSALAPRRFVLGATGAFSLADIDAQLARLMYAGVFARTPLPQLQRYPRYLRALDIRMDRLAIGGARDGERLAELRPHLERLERRSESHAQRGRQDPTLHRYRWLLEEYRVSLFAQELGTAEPVSPKRLERLWQAVSA